MPETPQRPLSDDDMRTSGVGVFDVTRDADTTDSDDADSTDSTDGRDSDSTDADTDSTDARA